MNKILYISLLFSVILTSAQVKKNTTLSSDKKTVVATYPEKDLAIYKNAMLLGDLTTATIALHGIIAANPTGAVYRDTLALVYLERGMYHQAQALAKVLYLEKENDTRTEVLAICAKQLNQQTEAIDFYKKLAITSKKTSYAFEQLQLEYLIKRLAEAKMTAEQILKVLSENDKTELSTTKSDNKTQQIISFKAGVYYLLGNINNELKNIEEAKAAYKEAIKINPEYDNALVALKILENK